MSLKHEDLVGYALGALSPEEMEQARRELAREQGGAEGAPGLEEIRRHLSLHESLPSLEPSPQLWGRVAANLDATPAPDSFVRRWWRPLAAAALLLVALLAPRDVSLPVPEVYFGPVASADGTTWHSTDIARLTLGAGVTLTLDAETTIEPLSEQRLALRAGRIFLEVEPGRRGFAVEACGEVVETTGTRFSVDARTGVLKVAVEEGTVRCSGLEVGAGEAFGGGRVIAFGQTIRDWFTRPRLSARILDHQRVRIVFRNDMPDPITLAPPTGGGPFCFLSFGGHDYPANPEGFSGAVQLESRGEVAFDLRLPGPLPPEEALFVSHPASRTRVQATR